MAFVCCTFRSSVLIHGVLCVRVCVLCPGDIVSCLGVLTRLNSCCLLSRPLFVFSFFAQTPLLSSSVLRDPSRTHPLLDTPCPLLGSSTAIFPFVLFFHHITRQAPQPKRNQKKYQKKKKKTQQRATRGHDTRTGSRSFGHISASPHRYSAPPSKLKLSYPHWIWTSLHCFLFHSLDGYSCFYRTYPGVFSMERGQGRLFF